MQRRERYQNGSLSCVGGMWWLRYYEHDQDGTATRRGVQVGTVEQFPSKRSARKKADEIMREVNEARAVVKFDHLCDAYKNKGIAHLREYSRCVYKSHIETLRKAFGHQRLDFLCTPRGIIHIEDWLNSLKTAEGKPISASMRKKHKVILGLMFRFAMKLGHLSLQANPIDLVDMVNRPDNTAPKRRRDIVTVEQYWKLLADRELPQICKVILQLCTMTGLRSCEAIGLKWSDVDDANGKIYVRRSVKGKYEDDPKTDESRATVPMHGDLLAILSVWKKANPPVNHWVFGSVLTGRPLHASSLQKEHLKPAGKRAGIDSLGWHNFRHTYRALGRQSGVSLEEQRMLMRHASIQQTADYGNDGIDRAEHLREPNEKIVSILRSGAA